MTQTGSFQEFEESIWYVKIADLKSICKKLQIKAGDKRFMVENILYYLEHKTEKIKPIIPQVSRGKELILSEDGLMLHGAYKNDKLAREFFKKLIGPFFHFTVYGIDWIKARWYAGKPPTFREFADFWLSEYERRKYQKPDLKPEWKFLEFCENHNRLEWHAEYSRRREIVCSYILRYLKKD